MHLNKYKRVELLRLLVYILLAIILVFLSPTFSYDIPPKHLYRVCLKGEKLGLIESKDEFDSYLNDVLTEIKETFNVDYIYYPEGLEINKELTYEENVISVDEMFEKIKNEKGFTVEGYKVTIKKENDTEILYVLSDQDFYNALDDVVRAFVSEEIYKNYLNNIKPNEEYLTYLEDIYINDEITIKQELISIDNLILKNKEEIVRYMTYGTLDVNKIYTVKTGDTIEEIADRHQLNVEEFLLVNPEIKSKNALLYLNQKVVVQLMKPIVDVVTVEHKTSKQTSGYQREIRYDSSMLVGYSRVIQAGSQGTNKVVERVTKVNGQAVDIDVLETVELVPARNEIIAIGERVVPHIGNPKVWSWPVRTSARLHITSGYGWRRKSFHGAIDIDGKKGDPIYAANNGTVIRTTYSKTGGNYIIINHNNGYYSYYGHLNQINVYVGQTVSRGQLIGRMGNTGYVISTGSDGTHLHFAIWTCMPFTCDEETGTVNPLIFY